VPARATRRDHPEASGSERRQSEGRRYAQRPPCPDLHDSKPRRSVESSRERESPTPSLSAATASYGERERSQPLGSGTHLCACYAEGLLQLYDRRRRVWTLGRGFVRTSRCVRQAV